jgi:hypothetical protein
MIISSRKTVDTEPALICAQKDNRCRVMITTDRGGHISIGGQDLNRDNGFIIDDGILSIDGNAAKEEIFAVSARGLRATVYVMEFIEE